MERCITWNIWSNTSPSVVIFFIPSLFLNIPYHLTTRLQRSIQCGGKKYVLWEEIRTVHKTIPGPPRVTLPRVRQELEGVWTWNDPVLWGCHGPPPSFSQCVCVLKLDLFQDDLRCLFNPHQSIMVSRMKAFLTQQWCQECSRARLECVCFISTSKKLIVGQAPRLYNLPSKT